MKFAMRFLVGMALVGLAIWGVTLVIANRRKPTVREQVDEIRQMAMKKAADAMDRGRSDVGKKVADQVERAGDAVERGRSGIEKLAEKAVKKIS